MRPDPWSEAAGALLFLFVVCCVLYGFSLAVVWGADKAGATLPRQVLACPAPAASGPR